MRLSSFLATAAILVSLVASSKASAFDSVKLDAELATCKTATSLEQCVADTIAVSCSEDDLACNVAGIRWLANLKLQEANAKSKAAKEQAEAAQRVADDLRAQLATAKATPVVVPVVTPVATPAPAPVQNRGSAVVSDSSFDSLEFANPGESDVYLQDPGGTCTGRIYALSSRGSVNGAYQVFVDNTPWSAPVWIQVNGTLRPLPGIPADTNRNHRFDKGEESARMVPASGDAFYVKGNCWADGSGNRIKTIRVVYYEPDPNNNGVMRAVNWSSWKLDFGHDNPSVRADVWIERF